MPSIDRSPAKGNLGPFDVRTDVGPDQPPPPDPRKLGFLFDAFPQALYDDYRDGRLKPIDLAVIMEMIRWGAKCGRRDSCWTCRKVIGEAIDRDPRTVQASWSRLTARGWIERATFDGPDRTDPDDPRNYTGSRIYFNWAPGRTRREPEPSPPPARRKRGRPRKPPVEVGEKFISPPREMNFEWAPAADPGISISPPPEQFTSPKGEDLTSKGETTTDPSRPREAAGSSSSSREGDSEGEGERLEPELAAKIEEIAPGPENLDVRRAIEDAARDMLKTAKLAGSRSPADHVRMAIEKAAANPKRRGTIESLARGIMRNWAKEGFPAVRAPEPPGRPEPTPDPEAERSAASERRRADAAADADLRRRRGLWESLPEPEKAEFRDEYERDFPPPPHKPLVKLWEVQRRDWCLERMGDGPSQERGRGRSPSDVTAS